MARVSLCVVQLFLYCTWLYVRTLADILWQDRRIRFAVWLLAVAAVVWRFLRGRVTYEDVVNEILIDLVLSVPFLR